VIPEWVKSHLWYLQVISPNGENPEYGVGFAFASEWDISFAELCCQGSEREKSLQQSSKPEWGNSTVE